MTYLNQLFRTIDGVLVQGVCVCLCASDNWGLFLRTLASLFVLALVLMLAILLPFLFVLALCMCWILKVLGKRVNFIFDQTSR